MSRSSECLYTETETVQLRRRHEDLETLLEMLRTFPEQEAADLLARIRSGIDPSVLVEQVRLGNMLMSLSTQGSSESPGDEAISRQA